MFLRLRPKTNIADLKPGTIATVEGTVRAETSLTLPIGKEDMKCVYYDVMTESYRRGARGKGRKMWLPDKVDRKSVDFIIQDDTGSIVIKADVQAMSVNGARSLYGVLNKSGTKRYVAYFVQEGDLLKVRGLVSSTDEESNVSNKTLFIGPDRKNRLEMLVKKTFSKD